MNTPWARSAWLLLAVVFLVFIPATLGLGLVHGLLAVIVCLLLMLAWHLVHLRQLQGWLEGPLNHPLPRGRGFWEIVFASLHRRVRIRIGQHNSLTEMLQRISEAVQALPDGIIAFNQQRNIEWMNERAERYFAISAGTDCGQALTNLIRQP